MVQCELCGAETSEPKSIKIEGAELEVCHSCASLGQEVHQSTADDSPSTKYSTSSSSSTASSASPSRSGSSGGRTSSRRRRADEMFDSLGELAQDYDERIRSAREERGLSQEELANELNEKRSLIRRLERGETLPSDEMQSKLERFFEIDLEAESPEGAEWDSDTDTQSFTLGEMAKRRD